MFQNCHGITGQVRANIAHLPLREAYFLIGLLASASQTIELNIGLPHCPASQV
jgi:hypothetical protein